MPSVALLVTVDGPDFDAEEREEHAADLGRVLRELAGTELAPLPAPPAPDGSKGAGALLAGVTVTVTASRKALAAVLDVLRNWAAVVTARKVVLEVGGDRLEITGATSEQADRALDLFVERHAQTDQ